MEDNLSDRVSEPTARPRKALHPLIKLLVDIGPLAAFFVAYTQGGLMSATAAIMAATAVALAVSFLLVRRVPMIPVFSAAVIMIFGGLTLWLDNEIFIKMKPTIINAIFASILLAGLATGRSVLKPLFDMAFHLTEAGWRGLSLRWALFFLAMALLNEVVWRATSTDVWVNFKVFGLLPLTFLFALAQLPFIQRHGVTETPTEESGES